MNSTRLLLCALTFMLLTTTTFAQTGGHRTGVSIGGGPMDYGSNIGNGFKLTSQNNSWHGGALAQVGTYLNPSFDLVFFGAIGDLSATRLKSVGVSLKYKFSNGYLMDESSLLKPYVYAGAAFNNLTDKINLGKGNTDNYISLNAGLGVRYYIRERIHIGYNLAVGYFIVQGADFVSNGGNNEMYFHNAIMAGIDLF